MFLAENLGHGTDLSVLADVGFIVVHVRSCIHTYKELFLFYRVRNHSRNGFGYSIIICYNTLNIKNCVEI
jgi:hypothetical protein